MEKASRKLNRPIKDDIIQDMAAQCKGNIGIISKKLTEYIDQNSGDIGLSILTAKKGLLKINEALDIRIDENKNAFSEIEKVCEAANYLKEHLTGLRYSMNSDYEQLSPLETHLQFYINSCDAQIEEHQIDDIENKEEAWESFINLLEYHSSVFERIKSSLLEIQPKRGGQNSAKLLVPFFVQVSRMYRYATGKNFKLSGYGNSPKKSESLNFIKKALWTLAGTYNGQNVPPLHENHLLLAYKYARQEIKKDSNREKLEH